MSVLMMFPLVNVAAVVLTSCLCAVVCWVSILAIDFFVVASAGAGFVRSAGVFFGFWSLTYYCTLHICVLDMDLH